MCADSVEKGERRFQPREKDTVTVGQGLFQLPVLPVPVSRHVTDSPTFQHGDVEEKACLCYRAAFHILRIRLVASESLPGRLGIAA